MGRMNHSALFIDLYELTMAASCIHAAWPHLFQMQERSLDEFFHLEEKYKSLQEVSEEYPGKLSPGLKNLQSPVVRQFKSQTNEEKGEF
jgi:hypothetical protein